MSVGFLQWSRVFPVQSGSSFGIGDFLCADGTFGSPAVAKLSLGVNMHALLCFYGIAGVIFRACGGEC